MKDELTLEDITFFNSLKVKEEDIPKTFFQSYARLADLMEVEALILPKDWFFATEYLGTLVSRAYFDEKLQEYRNEVGSRSFVLDYLTEVHTNKLGLESKKPFLREHFLRHLDEEIKELRVRTKDPIGSFVIPKHKVLVLALGDNILNAISHEAGHVLYDEQAYKPKRMIMGGFPMDSEIFAVYSSDVALRDNTSEGLIYFSEKALVKYLTPYHKMSRSLYKTIIGFYDDDFDAITSHMKSFFHGERGLLDFKKA